MKLTINHSLAILSRIAYINDNFRTLLDSCKESRIYCGVDEAQDLIPEAERDGILIPDLKINLDRECLISLIDTLEQIAKWAKENDNLVIYLDAHKVCRELRDLV